MNVCMMCDACDDRLADNLAAEGGLAMIILTHKDDIADHDKWKRRFPDAQRVIHK
jgi:hypothetical protein